MVLVITTEHIDKSFHLGDIVIQLLFLGVIALVIGLVVSIVRSNKKRRHQLNRIEKKIDDINHH
ncbi:MAG: hypothetical protein R3250_14095 [Melioribacteraceae bacterium]|nr:hypothetical protein [Melioribacteraceae bacterium]